MAIYVITGVSKGLGVSRGKSGIQVLALLILIQQFEILRQVSSDARNTVVGLVRDKPATEKKISEELGERPNIHILRADLTSYADLKVERT